MKRSLIRYFAKAWLERMDRGINDSSAPELIEEVGRTPTEREVSFLQDGLREIVIHLRTQLPEDNLIHTVNALYYEEPRDRSSYRKVPPRDYTEGRLVIPLGPGNRRYGIRMAPDALDWALIVYLRHTSVTHANQKVMDRTIQGLVNGSIPRGEAKKMFIGWAKDLRPDNRSVLGRIWNGVKNPLDL